MSSHELQPHLFSGRWIGETQGCAMPAHIWEIRQQGASLRLSTRWEHATNAATFSGWLLPDQPAFTIRGSKMFRAFLLDRQHFIVPGWCTNDARGGNGPDYDVVFSRPGIAELTARQAYIRYLEQIPQGDG
jgi:hypothetical protein